MFSASFQSNTTQPSMSSAIMRLAGMTGLIMSLSFNVMAEPIALTEKQVIGLFYQRNLELLAAKYDIENAQAQQIIAAAIPNPTISIQISEISQNSNQNASAQGCPQADINLGQRRNCGPAENYSFSQLIETAGKRGLRIKSSDIASQAAESDFRDAVRILTNMVRDAYYGLLLAQKNRWLAQEITQYFVKIVNSNRLRLKAGDISESDFLRIEMEGLKAQSDLDNTEAAVEQAQAALAMTLNWPDKSMQFAANEQLPEVKDIGQNLSKETLINKALAMRPDLQADKQRADQADKDLALARRLKYPDVTLSAGAARDPSNTVLNTYFVGVSVPLPLFYQYKGEESKATVNLNQMRLAAEETELGIRAEIVSSLATWTSADKVLHRFESDLLDHAQKVHNRSQLAYMKGAISVLDFIDAQRNYKSVMFDYYAAAINRIHAYYDLAKALGVEPDAALNPQAISPIDNARMNRATNP